MRKLLFIAAAVGSLAVPAMAEVVGIGVGPVGVGVTVARAIATTIGTVPPSSRSGSRSTGPRSSRKSMTTA
jgi:hypothetical protein